MVARRESGRDGAYLHGDEHGHRSENWKDVVGIGDGQVGKPKGASVHHALERVVGQASNTEEQRDEKRHLESSTAEESPIRLRMSTCMNGPSIAFHGFTSEYFMNSIRSLPALITVMEKKNEGSILIGIDVTER